MTRDAWRRVRSSVEVHEGLRLRPYRDTTGHLTIGYGRNLSSKGITAAEAVVLVDNDVAEAVRAVADRYPWAAELEPARWAVLVELMFNLGPERLALFVPTLALLQAGNYRGAAKRLRSTLWAEQVGPTRSGHLIGQLETGDWWQGGVDE